MPTTVRNTLLFVILAGGAAGTWLLRPAAPLEDSITTTSAAQRGYYMNDAVFSGLDSEGKIVFQLVAARIEGSEDSSLLNLSDVEINYAEDLDVPWLITAASAVSARDQDFLELHDVVLQRTADSPNERARIEATDIRLEPDTQIARTSGPVRFAIGTSSIEAVGLTADLRAERFRLESGVNARIAP